jgi:hypothetical protein
MNLNFRWNLIYLVDQGGEILMLTSTRDKFFPSPALRAAVISSFLVFSAFCSLAVMQAKAAGLAEGFEDLSALLANGWVTVNHSEPLNPDVSGWFQCTGTQIAPAYAGTTNSCVSTNFASGTGVATLNTWLIGPQTTFNNGDTIAFYTRTISGNPYPDRLQLRLSTSGASTNVGTSSTDVGDFMTLLLDINSTYQVGGYPDFWIQYSATISGLSGPTSGRFAFRYFVENGGPNGDNSYIVGLDSLTLTPAQHTADFDGDGKTDPTVARNTGGGATGQVTWFIQKSSDGSSTAQPWGLATDFFLPADFDGDHKADIAVWRAGPPFGSYFYILQSATNTVRADQFGQTGDDPTVIGDYDGDGKADPAVYRPGASAGAHSFWFFRASTGPQNGQIIYNEWGQNADFPAPGDYNGDGKNDFCVQRDNGGGQARFYVRSGNGGVVTTTSGDSSVVFGTPTDMIVPGDYDGDGKTDIAVTRGIGGTINWFVLPSSTGEISSTPFAVFGAFATDVLTQGDWDGDGRTDPAVWRPNADPTQNYFYVLGSSLGEMSPGDWGQSGDYPVANYNTH